MERIGKVLEEHENRLGKDLENLRVKSFGLGAESIGAVAGLELDRERILTEKSYFEKFMNTLVPGFIPKKKLAETAELLEALAPKTEPEKESEKKE